jgi:hypothetical protein
MIIDEGGLMNSKKIIFISVLALCVIITVYAQKKPVQPKIEKKVVVVKGDKAWTNTGLRIGRNDRVTITATGQVCFSGQLQGACVGPDGWPGNYEEDWPDDYGYCFDPLPDVNHAALVANIGNDNFFVGKTKAFTKKDGFLYLGINDCSFTGECSNSGEFSAVIKIERGPKK